MTAAVASDDRRVLDVGAGSDPDPRATETADVRETAPTDWTFDATMAWPPGADGYDLIVMRHVVEHLPDEAAAIRHAADALRSGGRLEIRAPLGGNAIGDGDHERVWNPGRATNYCRRRAQPWHDPPPLVLERVTLQPSWWGPFGALGVRHALDLLARRWPSWGARHASGGELVARYRRVEDDPA